MRGRQARAGAGTDRPAPPRATRRPQPGHSSATAVPSSAPASDVARVVHAEVGPADRERAGDRVQRPCRREAGVRPGGRERGRGVGARERQLRDHRREGRQPVELGPAPPDGELDRLVDPVGSGDHTHAAQPGPATARSGPADESAAPTSPSASQQAACSPPREYAATARSSPGLVAAGAREHEPRPVDVDQPHAGAHSTSSQRIGSPWSSHTASRTSGAPTGSWTVSCIRTLPVPGRLHAQPHGTPGRPSSARSIAVPFLGLDVLAHDRMPHHGQLALATGVERLRQPLRGAPRRHRDADRGRRPTARRACARSGEARRARCRRAA